MTCHIHRRIIMYHRRRHLLSQSSVAPAAAVVFDTGGVDVVGTGVVAHPKKQQENWQKMMKHRWRPRVVLAKPIPDAA